MGEQTTAPARPLYDRLQRIMLENGWTSVQLAEKAGVARGTIDNWRTQPRSPRADTIKSVAERLDIDYQEALTLAGIMGSAQRDTPPAGEGKGPLADLPEDPDERMAALVQRLDVREKERSRLREEQRAIAEEVARLTRETG